MTVQFTQIESGIPSLLPDSYKQLSSDSSFEEKLRFAQSRLGLFLFPFAQPNNYSHSFSQQNPGDWRDPAPEKGVTFSAQNQKTEQSGHSTTLNSPTTQKVPTQNQLAIFESLMPTIKTQNFSLQSLLQQSGWLTPNLAVSPDFMQAWLNGSFHPSYDLQALIDEIVSQATLVKGKGKTEITLTLHPAELGKVVLSLSYQAGVVSIELTASAEAKKLLGDKKNELAAALKRADVHCDKIIIEEVAEHV